MSCPPKLNQKGVIQIIHLLLLLGGLALGVYLVQNRTNILPKAYDAKVYNEEAEVQIYPEDSYIPSNSKFGIAIDVKNKYKIPNLDQLTALKPGWVRLEYKPPYKVPIFPKEIKTLVIFDYASVDGVPWEGDSSQWQSYIDKYILSLEEFLKDNMGKFNAIEVWNEQDICHNKDFYCPYVKPTIYASLLKKAAATIKKLSPTTKVISGGLASGEINYVKEIIQAEPEAFSQVDGFGVHTYERTLNNWCAQKDEGCAETLPSGDLKEFIENYKSAIPADVKIWVTEVGQKTTDLEWQKDYMEMAFDYLQEEAEVVIWYAWTDIMSAGDWDANMGLYDKEGVLKPAGKLFNIYSSS